MPRASLSLGMVMGCKQTVFDGLSWRGGLCHPVAVTSIATSTFFGLITVGVSMLQPHLTHCHKIWAGRRTGSKGAAFQSTGSIPVPSYQGTDSTGASCCMCVSQSRVSQRFLGLQ